MDKSKKILLAWGIISIFCIAMMFPFDFKSDAPQFQNLILISILVGIPSVFLIVLSFRHPRTFKWILEQSYTMRLKNINSIINSEGSFFHDLCRFLPLCVIIVTLTMYLLSQASFKIVLLLIPGSNFLQEASINCKTTAAILFQTNTIAFVAITLAGPIWIVMLRQIRKFKDPVALKIRGSQSLLFYCYFVIALFIASNFVDIGCPKAPGLYLYISPGVILSQIFTTALMGLPVSFMIFLLDRFVMRYIKA